MSAPYECARCGKPLKREEMVVPVYYVDGATFVVHTIEAGRFAHVTCPTS
ncbi:hypothetical protein QDW23_gp27 [Microbacterium phage Stromboli]|nr:hypothetical protein QDW21_gp28 [Microbacterium phage Stoor]YP_010752624.1 hypothetical protein QDW22_gp27 [Microbacterium Phage DirtyBubble]YP_010752691.1 hypothetical protein QDW23_gp27 [Microbacterium phage Stromboli]QTF81961.1 hypothetical protein SEA_BABYYODA_27 [Microbacterium phage BabyYoda]QDP45045.1 hypothetical protein DIRTYBUBBLE_27 [Microbacterium Phage DirtyBubble]QIN93686.1 hypothetical protein SEA_STROMBOLI_27 [Microbacterium phage Stromboli]QUE26068.1 hypothetical protein S